MEPRVCVLGTGNVSSHLSRWLALVGIKACVCSARTPENWPEADIYMLAVSDGAIAEVAQKLKNRDAIVVHLSGATPLLALDCCRRRGVVYPVQTFTKGVELDYRKIPLLIEGSDAEVSEKLWRLAEKMTTDLTKADSEQRSHVHLAGVITSNFFNHLLLQAQKQLAKSGFGLELLRPLIEETQRKAFETGPLMAQTGPARRNDQASMSSHLEMLADEKPLKEIYLLLSSSIKETYKQ